VGDLAGPRVVIGKKMNHEDETFNSFQKQVSIMKTMGLEENQSSINKKSSMLPRDPDERKDISQCSGPRVQKRNDRFGTLRARKIRECTASIARARN
jgi:hypothetical protein